MAKLHIVVAVCLALFLAICTLISVPHPPKLSGKSVAGANRAQPSPLPHYFPAGHDFVNTPPTPTPTEDLLRIQIAERIEFSDGWRVLGEVEIIQSDLLDMDNREQHRHSVLSASMVPGAVLSIERFDSEGNFMFVTFHSAENLKIEFPDKKTMNAVLPRLAMAGCKYQVPFDWEYYPVALVQTEPTPSGLLEMKEKLEYLTASSGKVSLCELPSHN
jgi:hypothetical protein